jgi:hypothetical protein
MMSARLQRSFRLGPARHVGARRPAAKPIPLGDEPAGALLRDILDANLDQRAEVEAVRYWVRRALRSAALRDSLDDSRRHASFGRLLTCAARHHPTKRATP